LINFLEEEEVVIEVEENNFFGSVLYTLKEEKEM